MTFEWLALLVLGLLIWYWLDGMRVREIATAAGRMACREIGVMLLDETVALQRLRLRRDQDGRLRWYRVFRFEFTSDGLNRYNGRLDIIGQRVVDLSMDVHRLPPDDH